MINLVFIGKRFYLESHSRMSSIYIDGTYERYDYGFLQIALENGETINIRQATARELEYFENKLQEMKHED